MPQNYKSHTTFANIFTKVVGLLLFLLQKSYDFCSLVWQDFGETAVLSEINFGETAIFNKINFGETAIVFIFAVK